MAEHQASITVNAPVEQVYALFTHFNDFPKFMRHIDEVTYLDENRSHWVADVVGSHSWEAINENWIPSQQIGWRSVDGLENSGLVRFEPESESQTRVHVTIHYTPPAGFLGAIGEALGAGKRFEMELQEDLTNFARLVADAPPGALDPHASTYLFNEDSAAWRGALTPAQEATLDENEAAVLGEHYVDDAAARAW